METPEIVHKHPVAIIAVGAVGFFILYSMLSGGGSAPAASGGTSDALQAAELNSASQLQMAQLGAQSQDNRTAAEATLGALAINAGLLGKYSDNETALKVSANSNDTGLKITASNNDLQKFGIGAQEAVALGQQKQLVDVAAITSAVNLAGISANRDTAINSTNALASVQNTQAAYNFKVQDEQIAAARHADNNKSSNDFFGNILGIGASLLSFL